MNAILSWLLVSVEVIVIAYFLPGVSVDNLLAALAVALVLGILNAVVKPILVVLTLPINILTLGLFSVIINTAIILLAAYIVPGFTVSGFWWAMIFGLVLSLTSSLINNSKKSKEEE